LFLRLNQRKATVIPRRALLEIGGLAGARTSVCGKLLNFSRGIPQKARRGETSESPCETSRIDLHTGFHVWVGSAKPDQVILPALEVQGCGGEEEIPGPLMTKPLNKRRRTFLFP
jgi:hypothetical protein